MCDFMGLAAPLTALLAKNTPCHFGKRELCTFESLKKALCNPLISGPSDTWTSHLAWSVMQVMWQLAPSSVRTLTMDHSLSNTLVRKLDTTQLNYPVHDHELLAVYLATHKWRCYLDGKHTVVYTNHKPLEHLLS